MKLTNMSDDILKAVGMKVTLRDIKDKYPGKWWNAGEGFTFVNSGAEYTIFDYVYNDDLIMVCYKNELCLHNDQRVLFAYKLKFSERTFVNRVRELLVNLFKANSDVTPAQLRIKCHLPICKNIAPIVEGGRYVKEALDINSTKDVYDIYKINLEQKDQIARRTSFARNMDMLYRPRDPAIRKIIEEYNEAMSNAPSSRRDDVDYFDNFYKETKNKVYVESALGVKEARLTTNRAKIIFKDDGKKIVITCTRNEGANDLSFEDLVYYLRCIRDVW